MAPQTSFTSQGMIATGQRFSEGVSNVHNIRQRLQNQMADLAARWGGQASGTFNSVMHDWDQQEGIICSQLQHIADLLGQGGKSTAIAEDDNRQTAQFFNG